jgi:hypothetical protein
MDDTNAPSKVENVPAGQRIQRSDEFKPRVGLYVPEGHLTQASLEVLEAFVL